MNKKIELFPRSLEEYEGLKKAEYEVIDIHRKRNYFTGVTKTGELEDKI